MSHISLTSLHNIIEDDITYWNNPSYFPTSSFENEDTLPQVKLSKEQIIEKWLESQYETITQLYLEHKYKKAYYLIRQTTPFESEANFYRIKYIQLRAIKKIISRKLKKHYDKPNIPHIEKWFATFKKELGFWTMNYVESNIIKDKTLKKSMIEILNYFTLCQLYLYARYSIISNFISDAIGFLGTAERLVKSNLAFYTIPDIFHIMSKIYLLISSLYISNSNYLTAKNYLTIGWKIIYQELELRLGEMYFLNQLFNFKSVSKEEHKKYSKIFLTMTLLFYQLGICSENEEYYEEAYQSYKQAKWFGTKFLFPKCKKFISILPILEIKCLMRYDIITAFKEEERLKDLKAKEKEKNEKHKQELFKTKKRSEKFIKLEKYIEQWKINEIDDDEPDLLCEINQKPWSKNVGVITKTVSLLNHLMDDQFNNIIKNFDKIEIHNWSRDTKQVIQKQIAKIKNNKRVLLRYKPKGNSVVKNMNKSSKDVNKTINFRFINHNSKSNSTNIIKARIDKSRAYTERSTFKTKTFNTSIQSARIWDPCLVTGNTTTRDISNASKDYTFLPQQNSPFSIPTSTSKLTRSMTINTNMNMNMNSNTNTNSNSNTNTNTKTNTNINTRAYTVIGDDSNLKKNRTTGKWWINNKCHKVLKYTYDPFWFNKKFTINRDYLKTQFTKELKFQKQLLKSKHNEKCLEYKALTKREVNNECSQFISKTIAEERKWLIEKQKRIEMKRERTRWFKLTLNKHRAKGCWGWWTEMIRKNIKSEIDSMNSEGEEDRKEYNKQYWNTIQHELELIKNEENEWHRQLKGNSVDKSRIREKNRILVKKAFDLKRFAIKKE